MIFKPNLIPNSKVEKPIIIPEVLNKLDRSLEDYIISFKKDGCRCEIINGEVKSRELKSVKSKWIQKRYKKLAEVCHENGIILEGEFYAHGMSFREICRFFKTTDVTDPKHINSLNTDRYKFNIDGTKKKPIWHKAKDDFEKAVHEAHGFISKFDQDWPGRSAEWLSTYHDDLKIWVFDLFFNNFPEMSYYKRMEWLISHIQTPGGILYEFKDILEIGEWYNLPYDFSCSSGEITTFDMLDELYEGVLSDGWEGLVLAYKYRTYKMNRSTAGEADLFKLKEDKLQFDGQVLDVLEGTRVKEGIAKTVNHLGRSVTSKLAEDREPSGIASGFLSEYDGHSIIVSLQGYSQEELAKMLQNKDKYIGEWFHYTGMKPTKNVPRHAFFHRGDWRDNK